MRLRIEFARKFDDLLPGDGIRPAIETAADGKVFKMEEIAHRLTIRDATEIAGVDWRNTINTDNKSEVSIVESKMHHVAIGDDIILAFKSKFARVACTGFTIARDIGVIGDGFRADETFFEIGVDDAGALGRF